MRSTHLTKTYKNHGNDFFFSDSSRSPSVFLRTLFFTQREYHFEFCTFSHSFPLSHSCVSHFAHGISCEEYSYSSCRYTSPIESVTHSIRYPSDGLPQRTIQQTTIRSSHGSEYISSDTDSFMWCGKKIGSDTSTFQRIASLDLSYFSESMHSSSTWSTSPSYMGYFSFSVILLEDSVCAF